jgi:hypothetical protein
VNQEKLNPDGSSTDGCLPMLLGLLVGISMLLAVGAKADIASAAQELPATVRLANIATNAPELINLTVTPKPICGIGRVTRCYKNNVGTFGSVKLGKYIVSKLMRTCWTGKPVFVCSNG